jgi:predicted lipid-binding transport protein (Tim44 family)
MGPVAGLAAGLGLAALASHLGFGDELASMVMMGLLAAAIMVVIGFVMRKRAAAQHGGAAAPGGLKYAHQSAGSAATDNNSLRNTQGYQVSMPPNVGNAAKSGSMIGSGLGNADGPAHAAPRIPSDFDKSAFEHNAKRNFVRLQAANDAADLNDIRQFTTPEMFAELQMELAGRGTAIQKTDVVRVDAEVTGVEESADRYWVSVRFTGAMRDEMHAPEESFDEVWHLTKLRHGDSGWLLSGIQQTA